MDRTLTHEEDTRDTFGRRHLGRAKTGPAAAQQLGAAPKNDPGDTILRRKLGRRRYLWNARKQTLAPLLRERKPEQRLKKSQQTRAQWENGGGTLRDGLLRERNPSARSDSPEAARCGKWLKTPRRRWAGPVYSREKSEMDESEPRNQQ
jgi:hypothetical protein